MNVPSRFVGLVSHAAVLLGLALVVPAHSECQRYSLTDPSAVFPEALSSVVGLRELSDGRVVVSDRLGQSVLVIDLDAEVADTIGREGGGPGEYRAPGPLFPWRGDSTIMLDLGNTRFTMIGPDGSFGSSTPLMTQDGDVMRFVMPAGTDRHGNVYFQARSFGLQEPGITGPPDSALVARWNLDSDVSDTVAALKTPATRMQSGGGNVAIMSIPFSPQDDWAVAWDGRVAVARGTDFRVEWYGLDGSIIRGPTVTYEPVKITQVDKDAWLEARANPQGGAVFIAVDAGGGARTAAPSRPARLAGPQIDDDDWPEVKPPFPARGVSVTPEGSVWVRRHVQAGAAPEYDVFDAQGRPTHTVVLPNRSQVVGFGNGVVFIARSDEYDLQWLERYERFWLQRR
ncbi:MAG: hypothetical protein JSW71_12585 [Gemmatimonadota bacterium]|nr:MAG: hypothetical protein JSW71_12585 [Gemmatimonadota bacterium]